jgi:hypothetical protein
MARRGVGVAALSPAMMVVVTLAACESGPEVPPESRITYDTIAGVEHVISGSRGTWADGERWEVPDSAVTIGTLDGPEEYTFGEIGGVTVAGGGRIYVGDTQTLDVRVYAPDGTFLSRFGRNGGGPGEFGNISGVTRAPEGIAVVDGQQARVTIFGLDGALVRTFRIERPFLMFEHDAAMAFDRQGRYFDRTFFQYSNAPDSTAVIRYRPDGAAIDTTIVGAQDPDYLMITRNETPIMGLVRPFTARSSLAFGPDGTTYFTTGAEYSVTQRDPSGAVVRVIRRPLGPRPVTAAERDSVRAWILERAREIGGDPPTDLTLPDRKAMIEGLEVDAGGHLWIRSQPDPSWLRLEWWVHDPEGRYLGAVATPRMEVMDIGEDYVAGVATDELGVQRVEVYPLVKPRPR